MFGRKQRMERYRDLVENYEKLLIELPIVKEKMDSIIPIDKYDAYEKNRVGVGHIDEQHLKRMMKYAKGKYDRLRLPILGEIANMHTSFMAELSLETLENNQELNLLNLNQAQKYLEKHKSQLLLPLNAQ
jgi:hypothetical protein